MKTYIETYLKTRFIQHFKYLATTTILFEILPDDGFYLYIDYQDLNHMIIKNQYFFLLIGKLLSCFSSARYFTILDITCAYYQMRI